MHDGTDRCCVRTGAGAREGADIRAGATRCGTQTMNTKYIVVTNTDATDAYDL